MARIRVILPTLAALLALVSAQPVLACGGLISVDPFGADIAGMTSMLSFDGSHEDLTVGVDYSRTPGWGDFAWLMPLPTKPQVSMGDFSGIARAVDLTTPPSSPPAGTVYQATPGSGELAVATVGNLQLVTLGAPDAPSIASWMQTNGFAFHDRQATVVNSYLDRGWVFVAARVRTDSPLAGRFTPVRFQFPSAEAVYPLAIAGADHAGTLPMRLFVLTPFRPAATSFQETVVRPLANGDFPPPSSSLELRYSAPLAAADLAAVGRTASVSTGFWLTEYAAIWTLSSLTTDLVLGPSPSQERIDFTVLRARFDAQAADWNRNYNAVVYTLAAELITIPLGLIVFLVLTSVFVGRERRRREAG